MPARRHDREGEMKAKQSILALACSILAIAASAQARADDGITIGMAVAMSGWMEAYDGEATKMAQLWVDQQNAKGGLLGKPIKVVSGDTKTDRVEGAKVGQALIQQGANLLLVSADYDYGAPAGLQAQKAGVISVFMGASDPKAGVIGVGPLSFTANNAGQLEGAVMADWAMKKRASRKAICSLTRRSSTTSQSALATVGRRRSIRGRLSVRTRSRASTPPSVRRSPV
jgi:branched-chain amino acid transport system substrate-binding protein